MGAHRIGLLVLMVAALGCEEPAMTPDSGGGDGGDDGGQRCGTSADCTDGVFCNGEERCAPGASGADARGCAAADGPACEDGETCDEGAESCSGSCDADGDGQESIACGGSDCDDDDANRFEGAGEVCDDDDEDCDPTTVGSRDADGDGYASIACCNGASCGPDCDDSRRGANPNAPEVCDTLDNDCDGAIDEEVIIACYVDDDGDGYALSGASSIETCECPPRTTRRPPTDAADCNDTLADVSPGSPEICGNGRDDDCDETIDEAGNDWYRDCDGDGYGAGTPVRACVSPGTPGGCPGGGHVLLAGDCDDASAVVYPGAAERCDGVPNDCLSSAEDGAAASEWCNGPSGPPVPPNTTSVCSGGACVLGECVAGFTDCTSAPGCETDLSTDADHCGACDNRCDTAYGACSLGRCGWRQLAAGHYHTCALSASGAVFCWGSNGYGQLGDGTTSGRMIPTLVSGLTDAVEIALGVQHTCARRASGAVACWGHNGWGQLGDGTTTGRLIPIPVSGLPDAVEIAAGARHTCARRASGTVVCWGYNSRGRLGDGTEDLRGTPTLVSGLTDAVEIAAGEEHTCARRASGAVVCWGFNLWGQLGDGTTTNRLTPTPVSSLTDAVGIAAGWYHTCARGASGAVLCWGNNWKGQLGDGTTTNRSAPTPVSGLTDAVGIATGSEHTCAHRASGAAVCWGDNDYGQLGDGTTTTRYTPTAVSGLTDAVEIAAGWQHTCAGRTSGAVVCWGHNGYGQLGDGTTTQRLTPTAVVPP